MWTVPNIWVGGDVWIIGGGPSVIEQFNIPKSVVTSVINKTATPACYSPYMESIHKKHIIAINASFMIGNWMDMIFFADKKFILLFQKELSVCSGIKICNNAYSERYNWVKYVPNDNKKRAGICEQRNKVSWNGNSGAAAISIAAHTGAKRIFLLGFDMNLHKDYKQHWHSLYLNDQFNPGTAKKLPFAKHLQGFPRIQQDAKRRGIEIFNVNPNSEIDCFEKITLKEALCK